jgi:hypothetical protein
MQRTDIIGSAVDLTISVTGQPQEYVRADNGIQPDEFQEMLRQAWLILNSRGRKESKRPDMAQCVSPRPTPTSVSFRGQ